MKQNKLILVLILIILSQVANAQDVNGIKVGTRMDKAAVIAAFGTPTNYESQQSEIRLNEFYSYGDSELLFCNNIFSGFTILDESLSVLTRNVPGGIKVGDPVSVFDKLNCGKPRYVERLKYFALFYDTDSPMYIEVKNGVITAFNFCLLP